VVAVSIYEISFQHCFVAIELGLLTNLASPQVPPPSRSTTSGLITKIALIYSWGKQPGVYIYTPLMKYVVMPPQ
jgi:hypothetical protein